MRNTRSILLSAIGAALAAGAIAGFGAACAGAGRQDLRHEARRPPPSTTPSTSGSSGSSRRWRRIRRPHQGRDLSGEPARPDPAQIEGVQFGSIQAWMGPPEFLVGVDVRYEALSAPGLLHELRSDGEGALRSGSSEDDVRAGRDQGPGGRRLRADRPVVDHHAQEGGQDARRPQGHEDPRARFAVPARADPPHGRQSGGDDACRRVAGHPAGHDRRRARRR